MRSPTRWGSVALALALVGARVGARTRARAAMLVVLPLLVVLAAAPARAHTELESSTPGPGATVDEPVRAIHLEYASAVSTEGVNAIGLFGPDGEEVAASEDVVVSDTVLALPVGGLLPTTGEYTVRWRITAADGDRQDGAFVFTYDGPQSEAAPSRPAPSERASTQQATTTPAPTPTTGATPSPTPAPVVTPTPGPAGGGTDGNVGPVVIFSAVAVAVGLAVFALSRRGRGAGERPGRPDVGGT